MDGRPNHLGQCKFAGVACSKCDATVPRHALGAHTAICSPTCWHCSRDFLDEAMLQAHVDASCPKVEVTCPTPGCGATVLREDLPHHAAEVCPRVVVECPYAAAGCRRTFPRDARAAHVHRQQEQHLALAMRTIEREPPHTTELLWTIDDAARHIREKTPALKWAPRSVIGPNGYKVAIKIGFDQTHTGEGYAGVYFGTRPGPNDHALGWPFPRRVSVALLVAATGRAPVALQEATVATPHDTLVGFGSTKWFGVSKFVALSDLSTGGCIGPDGKLRIRIRFSKLPRELTSTMVLDWTVDAVESRFSSGVMRNVTWQPDYTIGPNGYQIQLSAHFSGNGVGLFIGTEPGPFDDELE